MEEITLFAKTNFRNKEQSFGIKEDDRRRHMYVIGKTGMGKTNLIQNMAVQDIRNGKGVAVVDPHGEFAEECLKAVPANRINDVVYFNPADMNFPIAFNVLEKVGPESRHLVASGLVGVFKKIWADSWGPRLEYLLRNAILALLEYPTSTLLGVTRILVDKNYREKVLEKVTDPVVKSFWTEEFTKYHDRLMAEAISPIQNKVGQFLSSSLIRNIVGQTKSSFSIREVMDKKKILIMDLSKGRIGEDTSALLGAMMITKIQLAAMARVDMEESEREDFYLYVDEFQNFATESFANILSEARKYRLNLILAHQYIAQLDETVRDAVFGNIGTLITFRVGAMDAEVLEKEFEPSFYSTDLVNLAKYNIYLKLMIDGVAANPFSAQTLPPISLEDTKKNLEKIIKITHERYGTSVVEVEEKISRWSGVIGTKAQGKMKEILKQQTGGEDNSVSIKKDIDKELVPVSQEKKQNKNVLDLKDAKQEGVEMYKTQCSACDKEVEVPFKPDGKRPVFCKDCLKEYRRQQAKLQEDLKETEDKKTETKNKNNDQGQKKDSPSLKDLINRAMEEKKDD